MGLSKKQWFEIGMEGLKFVRVWRNTAINENSRKRIMDHEHKLWIERQDRLRAERLVGGESMGKENPSPVPSIDPEFESMDDVVYHARQKQVRLFGGLITEGSVSLLMGPKSNGKSTLVFQLCVRLAEGRAFNPFVVEGEVASSPVQTVYLWDLEMSKDAWAERLRESGQQFPNIKRSARQSYNVLQLLGEWSCVVDRLGEGSHVSFVLDNITRLTDDISQPLIAKRLRDGIDEIKAQAKKRDIELTVILVAHVTNDLNPWQPITLKSLSAADAITTGLDYIFALGPSRVSDEKILKPITYRHDPMPDEVAVLRFNQSPYLSFEIVRTAKEADVIPLKPAASKGGEEAAPKPQKPDDIVDKARTLKADGFTAVQTAEHFGITRPTLNNWLKEDCGKTYGEL